MVTIYCLKCRKKVEVEDTTEVVMKNGRKALTAKCPECGGKLFRILPSVKKEENKEVEKEMDSFDESK